MQSHFRVLLHIRGKERYIYVYTDEDRDALINAFRDQAADPRLSMTWSDANVLTEAIRKEARTVATEAPVLAPPVRF